MGTISHNEAMMSSGTCPYQCLFLILLLAFPLDYSEGYMQISCPPIYHRAHVNPCRDHMNEA